MDYKLKNAQFIRISDTSYMYEIQPNGESVQQHKKAFFHVHLETEHGEGVFILHAAYSKEGEWTRFLIEHELMDKQCCICLKSSDEVGIYCSVNQQTLRQIFEEAIKHPNVQPQWELEKQTL